MARRKKKNSVNKGAILMGVFVIVIMIASTLAYVITSYGSNNPELDYNDYKFSIDQNTGLYLSKIGGEVYSFYYHPTNVENLAFSSQMKNLLQNSQFVIISFDPELDSGLLTYADTFRFELQDFIQQPVIGGVLKEKEGFNFPVITCENASQATPVVVLNDSINTGIELEDSCLTVNARGPELFRVRDRIAYSLLGVIDDE